MTLHVNDACPLAAGFSQTAATLCVLKQSSYLLCGWVQVNVKETRPRGETRHGGHCAHQRVEEASSYARSDIPHGKGKSLGSPLHMCLMGEREVGLSHADGEVAEAYRCGWMGMCRTFR